MVDELTAELQERVAADGLAVPEAIDPNALTLLESGILRPAELENLRLRFEGNSTMTRFVARYAGEAAKKEEDRHKREQLTMTQKMAEDELDGVLRRWNDLLEAAKVCSGQSRDRQEDPRYVVKISRQWERLTEQAVKDF